MHTFYFQLVCDFLPPSVCKGWSEVVVLNPLIPQTGSLFNQLGKSDIAWAENEKSLSATTSDTSDCLSEKNCFFIFVPPPPIRHQINKTDPTDPEGIQKSKQI